MRTLVLSSIIILLIAAAVGWTIFLGRSPGRGAVTRWLPDGSVLTLKAATYQKQYRIRSGNRWRDYVGTSLPELWANEIGCRFVTIGGRTNALDVWLAWDGYPSANPPYLSAATFDEHGCEFGLAAPNLPVSFGAGPQTLTFQFTEFPRRGKTVGIRLYRQETNDTWSTLATFSVPNPDKRAHPAWQAEALPSTKSMNGADFTLLEVKTGIMARHSPPRPAKPGESAGAWLAFRIVEKGRPTSVWEFAGIKGISDAFGQTVARSGYASSSPGAGEFNVTVDAGLCRDETAWSVEVEFARAKDFPANDLWTIRSVLVPDAKAASVTDAATNLHGAAVRFCGIVGQEHPEPRMRRSLHDRPVAHLVCSNLSTDVKLQLVRAVDDRGREVTSNSTASDSPNYLYGLALFADAKTVDFTFAVTKRVAIKYQVKPSRFTANELEKR